MPVWARGRSVPGDPVTGHHRMRVIGRAKTGPIGKIAWIR
jgi:hypothetical protein